MLGSWFPALPAGAGAAEAARQHQGASVAGWATIPCGVKAAIQDGWGAAGMQEESCQDGGGCELCFSIGMQGAENIASWLTNKKSRVILQRLIANICGLWSSQKGEETSRCWSSSWGEDAQRNWGAQGYKLGE